MVTSSVDTEKYTRCFKIILRVCSLKRYHTAWWEGHKIKFLDQVATCVAHVVKLHHLTAKDLNVFPHVHDKVWEAVDVAAAHLVGGTVPWEESRLQDDLFNLT